MLRSLVQTKWGQIQDICRQYRFSTFFLWQKDGFGVLDLRILSPANHLVIFIFDDAHGRTNLVYPDIIELVNLQSARDSNLESIRALKMVIKHRGWLPERLIKVIPTEWNLFQFDESFCSELKFVPNAVQDRRSYRQKAVFVKERESHV